jgi:hypothetical protein
MEDFSGGLEAEGDVSAGGNGIFTGSKYGIQYQRNNVKSQNGRFK